jgi:hypothetical protein
MEKAARRDVKTVTPFASSGPFACAAGGELLEQEDEMSSWEYKILDVGDWEFGRIHDALADFRRQGWELACAVGAGAPRLRPESGGLLLRLRRPAYAGC